MMEKQNTKVPPFPTGSECGNIQCSCVFSNIVPLKQHKPPDLGEPEYKSHLPLTSCVALGQLLHFASVSSLVRKAFIT